MNLLQTLRSRKYLQRIILSFMLFVAMLAFASPFLNAAARDKVLSLQHEAISYDLKIGFRMSEAGMANISS